MSFGSITINGRGRSGMGGGIQEGGKTLGGSHIQEVFLVWENKSGKGSGENLK